MKRGLRAWRIERDTYADELAYIHESSDLILTVYKGSPEGHTPVEVHYVTNKINGALYGEYGSIKEAEETMRKYARDNPDGGELMDRRTTDPEFDFTGGGA